MGEIVALGFNRGRVLDIGGKLWVQRFFVSTISDNINKEEIRKYIKEQKKILKQLKLL